MTETVSAGKAGPGRRALIAAALLVTAGLVVLALRTLDPGAVGNAVLAMDPVWLAPSLALLVLGVAIRVVRWHVLFVGPGAPSLRAVGHALVVGLFFNSILPLRAGEAARLVALHRRSRVARSRILGTIAVERVFDVLALLVLLALALPWLPDVPWLRGAAILGGVLALAAALASAALVLYGERPLRALAGPLRRLPFVSEERWEGWVRNLAAGLAGLREARPALAGAALTLVSWVVFAASYWILMPGFGLELGFGAGVLVLVATGLGMTVPSGPAAVGVFEAAAVVALLAYGVPAEAALSYALVLHAVNFFPYVAGGLVLVPGRRR